MRRPLLPRNFQQPLAQVRQQHHGGMLVRLAMGCKAGGVQKRRDRAQPGRSRQKLPVVALHARPVTTAAKQVRSNKKSRQSVVSCMSCHAKLLGPSLRDEEATEIDRQIWQG